MTSATEISTGVVHPEWCAVTEQGFQHSYDTKGCLSAIELAKLPAAPACPAWCDQADAGHSWQVQRSRGGFTVEKMCDQLILRDGGSNEIIRTRYEVRELDDGGGCTWHNVEDESWRIGDDEFTEAQIRSIGLALVAATNPDVEAVPAPIVVERARWSPLQPLTPKLVEVVDKGVTDHAWQAPDEGTACRVCGHDPRQHLHRGTGAIERWGQVLDGDPVGFAMQLVEDATDLADRITRGQLDPANDTTVRAGAIMLILSAAQLCETEATS